MFDDDVLSALRHSTPESPAELIDILGGVDARQRLVLTLDELNQALEALVTSGRAQQVDPVRFAAGSGSNELTPVSASDYEAAVRRYTAPRPASEDDEDDEMGDVVVLEIDRSARNLTEAELDEFTDAPDATLGERADILGFEFGSDVIELHVEVESGHDTQAVVATISEAAAASPLLAKWSVRVNPG